MIKNWDEIKDIGWDNLLLGNGFSTNVWSKYSYRSLYEYSLENKIEPVLCSKVQAIFEELQTINFEEVLKALAYAILVKKSVGEESDEYLTLYKTVQDNLFNTVHAVHVKHSDLKKSEIAKEIKSFKKVFTTCYDLILYWATFGVLSPTTIADFFWSSNSSFDPEDTDLYGNKSGFYYLHGALHLQQDLKGKVSKLSYTSESLPSKEEFSYQGNNTKVPLYISEGTSKYKLNKIQSNSYLTFCYKSFSEISGSLLVIGHSLDEDYDNHLVEAIRNNKALTKVAVSIYSEFPDKDKLVKELEARLYRHGLELVFFESSSYALINDSVKVQA